MTDRPILVLGATGGQGGAVAAALLNRGTSVRAMARRPDKPAARRLADRGVDVVAGSLDDRAALGAAMRGVDAVFALTTPFEADIDAEVTQGHAILAAAVEAHVPHMVFSSVASADQHTGCLISRARRSSKERWPQPDCRTRSSGPRTFSTTRWVGWTASGPEYSICRSRPTVRCSSWPAQTWEPSSRMCFRSRSRMSGSASSWPVTL